MKVSVIIPAYNTARYIGQCIESVKAQTYADLECIIVDDGSMDNTLLTAVQFTEGCPNFTVIHKRENKGLSAARNTGIEQSTGDALYFLDSDDWIDPDTIERLVGAAEHYPTAGRIFTSATVHWEKDNCIVLREIRPLGLHEADSPYLFKDHSCDVGYATGGLYVRKNIREEIRFNEQVFLFEDMLFNMGLMFSGMKTALVSGFPYHYRRHGDSMLATSKFTEEDRQFIEDALRAYADKWHPSEETFNRCFAFMDMTFKKRLERRK